MPSLWEGHGDSPEWPRDITALLKTAAMLTPVYVKFMIYDGLGNLPLPIAKTLAY